MQSIQGDLLALAADGTFDVIIHGCNCQNAMGAGIAKSIRHRFPAAYDADLATKKGSRDKLGTFSSATIDCDKHSLTIVNAYTQFHWQGSGVKADYDAIRAVFQKIKSQFRGKRIGYPVIGAGLAGGDWNIISQIIVEELNGEDHTLVRFESRPTRQHFKLCGDTADGEEGLFYYEVEDGMIVRQICIVEDRIYWADVDDERDDAFGFTDQPEFDVAAIPDLGVEEVRQFEFDTLWHKGKTQASS